MLLLLLILAGGSQAMAQGNNCYTVICPPDQTNYVCSDTATFTPQNYPLQITTNCPPPLPPLAVACNIPPGTPLGVGVHSITCTFSSGGVVLAQCAFRIFVLVDNLPPVISCPANMVVPGCASPTGGCGAVVNYPPPVASDNSGMVAVNCAPPSGSFFPCGVTPVTCTAVDRCQRTSACQFTVTVQQGGNPPSIQCPQDIVVNTCNQCEVVPYPAPVVMNGTLLGCTPPPTFCFPLGTTTVNCEAANPCGTNKCSFTVTVRPVPPPSITCPPNIVATLPCGTNCVPVTYPAPVVTGGTLVACNPPSGTCFPAGVHPVVCLASNICGQIRECTFEVRVIQGQGEPPSISCPNDLIVNTCSNCAPVTFPAPIVVNGTLIGCNPPSGTCFPLGVNLVTCEAVNPCGTNKCTFTITVRPVPPPSIECPSNITATLACGTTCVNVTYPAPVVTGGTLIGCLPPSGTCFPLGVHTVTCRATNDCGQVAGCEFQVRVIQGQGEPPILTCPANLLVTTCSNCAPVTYTPASVVNGGLVGCNPPPGTCFPLGVNTVTCTATNACGTNTCSFTVTVRPVPPAVIECPSNIVVSLPCGSTCVPVTYTPVVTGGTLVGCTPPSGTCFPLGVHTVICRATNDCGQVSGCEFQVRVIEGQGQPPVLDCPPDLVVTTCSNNCQVVNYTAPGVANGVLVGCFPPSGTCFPIGVTTVNCVATNDCGSATCSFKIIVREIPTVSITCPSNIVVQTCQTGEIVTYPAPTVLNGTLISCNPPSGSFFPVGTNTVTCCAVDQCQRTACCTFTVTVVRGNPCVKPPLNMVLWLPFDELVPPIANNIVAGAPNGVHANGPVPLPGQFVLNSLGFDGANDYVRVPNYAGIVLSVQHFSIDAWVRRGPQDNGRRVIVSKLRNVTGAVGLRGYEYYLNNGVMNLFLGGPIAQNFNSGVVVPADGNWHHVTVTVRRGGAGAVRFYLDGVQVNAQFGAITAPIGNSGPLHVGASTPVPANFFRGHIDEVEIFNRVLTPAEIAGLFNAGRAGKCKIKVSIPWDVPFPQGSNYVTVNARIWNCTAVPQPVTWNAGGPMPIPTSNGTFVLPPFVCTNVPIQLCRPTNNVPVGSIVRWWLQVFPGTQCPIVATGSVINPGPVIVTNPADPVGIAGTNQAATVRIGLNGLPPGQPVRIRVIGPDMEPDLSTISLNGLPPGQPVIVGGGGGFLPAAEIPLEVRFTDIEPIGLYTLLIEADVNGDGEFDTLSSVDVENTLVPPTTIRIVRDAQGAYLEWDDLGDGFGTLETSDSVLGPWTPIPGARPPFRIDLSRPASFFDVFVDYE